jgi:hypothetical protein
MTTLRDRILACKDGYDVLHLDPNYEGSCPCFSVKEYGRPYAPAAIEIHGHCWRVDITHPGCGLHVSGINRLGNDAVEHMKRLLDAMDWYGDWTVVEEEE